MLLVAWVRFVRDGPEVPMSKRSGEFLTLDELLEEVGADAARWSFASRAASTPIDVDLELMRQSAENPVYYVQYAHARICSILAKAAESGLERAPTLRGALADDEVAAALARDVLRLPEVVEDAASLAGRSASRPTRWGSPRRSTPSTGTGAWSTQPIPRRPHSASRSST